MAQRRRHYIPAAGFDWLLPLYDPLQRWVLREDSIKPLLIHQAKIQPGQRVLDIGCGTASLTVLIKRLHREADVFGLDPDPKALAIACRKSTKAAVDIQFDEGFSNDLPYPGESFDLVFSSFMFHHLTGDEKVRTLREVRRVLAPGGTFHLLDLGRPRSRFGLKIARFVHRGEHARDNIEGRLPSLMSTTGFSHVEQTGHRSTIFGNLSYYRASSLTPVG